MLRPVSDLRSCADGPRDMRATYKATVTFAQERHNATGQTRSVTPWISLGAGYRRLANFTWGWGPGGPKQEVDLVTDEFSMAWDFDRVYSWQFGAELNIPWFGEPGREAMFAPWRHAEVVVFFPSVFDWRSTVAGQDGKSTAMMQHFVSYVRGANGLAGAAIG